MKTLTTLLTEGKVEKAAEDYLSKMVKRSPFKGKVYIAGGYVRDVVRGANPKDIDLVVAMPEGGIKFAEWLTKKIGVYKRGSNPVVYPKFGTAKFMMKGVTHNGQDLSGLDIEAVMTRKEQYRAGDRKPDVSPGTILFFTGHHRFNVKTR
jgi:tRNA nucleotidyltransferase/poly(A) polymerase